MTHGGVHHYFHTRACRLLLTKYSNSVIQHQLAYSFCLVVLHTVDENEHLKIRQGRMVLLSGVLLMD